MLTQRHKRLAGWLAVLVGVMAVLVFVKIDDRVSGRFLVRPAVRSELRAIRDDMPSFLRAALGPEPDHDDDDH